MGCVVLCRGVSANGVQFFCVLECVLCRLCLCLCLSLCSLFLVQWSVKKRAVLQNATAFLFVAFSCALQASVQWLLASGKKAF